MPNTTEHNEVVTSLGNAWIICRSKSYEGRIYYFNTLTGEAVWNLSEPEIEKAKTTTKIYESQKGFQMHNCPEPSESPSDDSSQGNVTKTQVVLVPNTRTPKIYNKQVINNKFSKSVTPFDPQYANINPVQFNIPITPALINPVWNIPSQHVFVAPSQLHQQPIVTNSFNNFRTLPVSNTSVPLSNRFSGLSNQQSKSPSTFAKPSLNKNNYGRNNYNKQFNKRFQKHNIDLRQLLKNKRRETFNGNQSPFQDFKSEETASIGYSCYKPVSDLNQQKEPKGNSYSSYTALNNIDGWKKENIHQSSPKNPVDVTPLKKLLHVYDNSDIWYIVPDSNVLLNNINFIRTLLISDTQCRVMVSKFVMEKIQSATNSLLRTHAHKAAYFISELVDENLAIIDDEKNNINLDKTEIINSCLKFVDQKYHVVLLTDDVELHNFKNTTNIPILSISEMRNLLNNNKSSFEETRKNPDNGAFIPSRSIKITIPNDKNKNLQNNIVSTLDKDTNTEYDINKIRIGSMKDSNSSDVNQTYPKDIETDDVAVQADVTLLTKDEGSQEQTKPLSATNKGDVQSNTLNKSKGFQLKRSYSHHELQSGSANNEKIQLKWCKRKAMSSASSVPAPLSIREVPHRMRIDDNIPEGVCDLENIECGISSYASSESLFNRVKNISYDDSNDSNSVTQRFFKSSENFIVEETSTSTNTLSNVDTESDQNLLQKEKTIEDKANTQCEDKNVMFEVTSQEMENYLRIKCDEWVSRFTQIMEEAVAQVLHLEPKYVLDAMPPPWTLYEATECVKRKFHYDCDVVDAANKLLNVLFGIGGLRGRLKSDLEPHNYMEMYSFGVYLIDALQGILNNSDDLQSAAESLSKLLSDIQDPHSDPNNLDSFNDIPSVMNFETSKVLSVLQRKTDDTNKLTNNKHFDSTEQDSFVGISNVNVYNNHPSEYYSKTKNEDPQPRYEPCSGTMLIENQYTSASLANRQYNIPGSYSDSNIRNTFANKNNHETVSLREYQGKINDNVELNRRDYFGGIPIKEHSNVNENNVDNANTKDNEESGTPCRKDTNKENEITTDEPNPNSNRISADTAECESPKVRRVNDSTPSTPNTPGKYNLRSLRKKILQEKESTSDQVTFIRKINIKDSFFKSLNLKKILNKDIFEETSNNTNEITSSETSSMNMFNNVNQINIQETEETCEDTNDSKENSQTELDISKNTNEPKIIRNFTKCLEFEEKLKQKESICNYDSWTNRPDNDYAEEEEELDYEFLEDEYYDHNAYHHEQDYLDYESEEMDIGIQNCQENDDAITNNDRKDIDLKFVIGKIENEIRQAFSLVHSFCKNSHVALGSAEDVSLNKNEIQEKAEETRLYVNKLCIALNSILTRETNFSEHSILEILNYPELDNININHKDLEDYRGFITKCLEQGNILKDSVTLILDASKE